MLEEFKKNNKEENEQVTTTENVLKETEKFIDELFN